MANKPTLLNFGRDIQGYVAYAPTTAVDKYSAALTAGAATSITVPSTAKEWIAVFSYQPGTVVWVNLLGSTAAVPAGSTLAAIGSEMNPAARTVYAGDVISVITNTVGGASIGISLYAVSYT